MEDINMAENKMKEVAKLLGLKLDEEFTIKGVNCSYRFKLTMAGLMSRWKNSSQWNSSGLLEEFITGHYQISKEKINSVLDAAEKKYLSAVIKPFRNKVYAIAKYDDGVDNYYIQIAIKQNVYFEYIDLPYFKKGTMYKGMELKKEYTVEQLGL